MTSYSALGYPYRTQVAFAILLAVGLVLYVMPIYAVAARMAAGLIAGLGGAWIVWRSLRLHRAAHPNSAMLAELTKATAYLPLRLRTQMPVVMVMGDALEQLFDRVGAAGMRIHVGDGAIWLRVDSLQNLPLLAVAVRQWRDGRVPDGVVLALSPNMHADGEALTQSLRLARQAMSDTARLLGAPLPGYLAVYQRVTDEQPVSPVWFGVSAAKLMRDEKPLEAALQAADREVQVSDGAHLRAWRAASVSGLMTWTRNVVLPTLQDRRHPAVPWPLYGVAWVDVGPAVTRNAESVWGRALQSRLHLGMPPCAATSVPWPLPEPLLGSMPRQKWVSPRWRAVAHALCLLSLALSAAFCAVANNNRALLAQVFEHVNRFESLPIEQDEGRRDALKMLVVDRDRLEHYLRNGVPPRLDFAIYHGAAVIPILNGAIASYQPPVPAPATFTLDSVSLFDTGRATLKPGSARLLVNALDSIKAHPGSRVLVAGHTDNVGDASSNLRLSVARALAVRDWLMTASNIPVTRFAIQGYGDTRPVVGNDSVDGRARNRRVEITLVPDDPGG